MVMDAAIGDDAAIVKIFKNILEVLNKFYSENYKYICLIREIIKYWIFVIFI